MHTKKILALVFSVTLIGMGCTNEEPAEQQAQQQGTIQIQQQEEEQQEPLTNQLVTLKTNAGDIQIELFLEQAPITAGNFLKLAEEDFYDGVTFHRVIPDFMIQGGDPLSKDDNPANDGTGGPGYVIEDEFFPGSSNLRGTLSMANAGPGTGGSQFFINLDDNTFLDYDKQPASSKHAVFGEVVSGMDVVEAISLVERDTRDRPLDSVIIQDIVVDGPVVE